MLATSIRPPRRSVPPTSSSTRRRARASFTRTKRPIASPRSPSAQPRSREAEPLPGSRAGLYDHAHGALECVAGAGTLALDVSVRLCHGGVRPRQARRAPAAQLLPYLVDLPGRNTELRGKRFGSLAA